MTRFEWTKDLESKTYKDALHIRHVVFVDEQKVPVDLEIDDLEVQTEHLVVYDTDVDGNEPIATARILELENDTYKVQRVATLKPYRGQGYGAKLMREVEAHAKKEQAKKLVLGAQNTAIPFYEKLGYTTDSEEYMDAGIPHHDMIKKITSE